MAQNGKGCVTKNSAKHCGPSNPGTVPTCVKHHYKAEREASEDRVGVQCTGDSRKLSGALALKDSSAPPAAGPAESKGPRRKGSSAQQAWQDPGEPGVGLNSRGLAWKSPPPCLLDVLLSAG